MKLCEHFSSDKNPELGLLECEICKKEHLHKFTYFNFQTNYCYLSEEQIIVKVPVCRQMTK